MDREPTKTGLIKAWNKSRGIIMTCNAFSAKRSRGTVQLTKLCLIIDGIKLLIKSGYCYIEAKTGFNLSITGLKL